MIPFNAADRTIKMEVSARIVSRFKINIHLNMALTAD